MLNQPYHPLVTRVIRVYSPEQGQRDYQGIFYGAFQLSQAKPRLRVLIGCNCGYCGLDTISPLCVCTDAHTGEVLYQPRAFTSYLDTIDAQYLATHLEWPKMLEFSERDEKLWLK